MKKFGIPSLEDVDWRSPFEPSRAAMRASNSDRTFLSGRVSTDDVVAPPTRIR